MDQMNIFSCIMRFVLVKSVILVYGQNVVYRKSIVLMNFVIISSIGNFSLSMLMKQIVNIGCIPTNHPIQTVMENGIDEFACRARSFHRVLQKALRCPSNKHYCIQLINNHVNATCITGDRAGNGIIDCIGGTDERFTSICLGQHPYDFKRRFFCV